MPAAARANDKGKAEGNNFGFFGTPQRDLVFDLNDFDETVVGPWD
ncbi:DUF2252 family protein [Alloacidobacterium dinghuense]